MHAWSVPVEVTGLALAGKSSTALGWPAQDSATVYDDVSALLSELRADGGFTRSICRLDDGADESWTDTAPDPAAGTGFYYLVRAQSVCGDGGWGAREVHACP